MISRTQTRNTIKQALYNAKSKGAVINYPMTKFRHAIFETVDKCKALKFHSWNFDEKEELTICSLFYQTTSFSCVYSYKTDLVTVSEYNLKNEEEVLISTTEIPVEKLADFIHQKQPKIKIVLKKAK